MSLFHHDSVLPGEVELKAAISELVKRFSRQQHLQATAPDISVQPLTALQRANVLIKLDGPDAPLQAEALKTVLAPDLADPTYGFTPNQKGMPEGVEVNYSLPIDKMAEVAGKLTVAVQEVGDNTFTRRMRAAQAKLQQSAGKQ